MSLKQISLTMPRILFEVSKEYSQEFGYRTLQEFILDLVRDKVIVENFERYREIEERMKKGSGVKGFDQEGAIKFLKGL